MGRVDIEFKEEIFSKIFLPFFSNRSRFLVYMGGAGSGKSYAAAQKVLIRCFKERNHNIIIIRKVARTHKLSTYKLFKKLVTDYGLTSYVQFKDSTYDIHIPITNSWIYFCGVDDVEKLKSIENVTSVWVEEATELTFHDWIQLNLRMRGVGEWYKQMILTFNPIDEFHWLKKTFFDEEYSNSSTLVTTYRDNDFIDPEYEQQLLELQNIDPVYWKIYGLAEWATAEGLIFNNWRLVDSMPEVDDSINICYGLDFGFNSPSALTQCIYYEKEIYLKEMFYEEKLNTMDIISKIKSFGIKNAIVYCDHDPEKISELRKAGINAKPQNKKSVYNSIDYMKRYKLNIDSTSSNGIKELQAYKWKEDKNGNPTDEPVKFMDHFIDGARTAIFTHGVKYWRTIEGVKKSSRNKKIRVNKYQGFGL